MGKREARQSLGAMGGVPALILGGLLALGIELLVLLAGAVAVSLSVLRADAAPQITAAACLLGCFIGGSFACRKWKSRRLIAGLLTGMICFLLILLIALIGGNMEFGSQALIELAGCVIGGGLSGILAGRRKKTRKKGR